MNAWRTAVSVNGARVVLSANPFGNPVCVNS
jgi:hypothetical protein